MLPRFFTVTRLLIGALAVLCVCSLAFVAEDNSEPANHRKPANDQELQYWLGNMIWHHRYSDQEVQAATGLTSRELAAAKKQFNIYPKTKPKRAADAPLRVLPYPGGRHPRIGFLDGAIRPQRETKVSVFTPWDANSYFVVDVPEAIWSNLGLTYLAHTHVPTIWTKQDVTLKQMEWNRRSDGTFDLQRKFPNGISYTAKVIPKKDHVLMEMTLTNGTKQTLSNLRVQNCVMLKGAVGFTEQTKDNKVLSKPYVAARAAGDSDADSSKKNKTKQRWVITAWDPCHRPWANAKCPCLHSDPKFPDCEPGQTKRIVGWLSFYVGDDVQGEFKRIEKTGWRASTK